MIKPFEIKKSMIDLSINKCNNSFLKILLLGFMGGMFVALGSVAAIIIWANTSDIGISKFLGAFIFPVGIILVVMAGGSLFTGNILIFNGLMAKKIKPNSLLKNLLAVYIGNFLGSMFIVLLIYFSKHFDNNSLGQLSMNIAIAKTNYTFSIALIKGILCNLLVAVSIWASSASNTVIGKSILLWFPVAAFVISGYEHIVANMFFIPMGMILGANISASNFLTSLFAVTIGNVIGGLVISIMYHFIYNDK